MRARCAAGLGVGARARAQTTAVRDTHEVRQHVESEKSDGHRTRFARAMSGLLLLHARPRRPGSTAQLKEHRTFEKSTLTEKKIACQLRAASAELTGMQEPTITSVVATSVFLRAPELTAVTPYVDHRA